MELKDIAKLYRKRFHGRTDVYGTRWASKDGKRSGFMPACINLWSSGCHIRLKDGVPCVKCQIRSFPPVTDESVLKHITGEEQHIYYVLLENGTVKFSALDFDFKPGKEDKGYSWSDVLKVHDLLESWGIPHGIARSTNNGYHVYFFFNNFYPANKFRAIILEVFEQVGFLELSRLGIKPLVEIFPKQCGGGVGSIGNGIKTPGIIPRFKVGRNCWVTPNNEVIEDQWGYFASIPDVDTEHLDNLIKEKNIEIIETGTVSPSSKGYTSLVNKRRTKWQPPLTGSIEKVLEGCSAFRTIRDKCYRGEELGHFEGFGLYHLAMSTADGLDWFKKNVKGWGENEQQMRQLEQSLEKNYSPWTCARLQTESVCAPGTKCFDKKPPIDMVEGRHVVRTDVPESEWPSPSPVRFAFSKGDDFLVKLQAEAEALKGQKDNEQKLRDVVYRAQVFDESQQAVLKQHIFDAGLVKKRELNRMFKDATSKKFEELKGAAEQRTDTVLKGDMIYRKLTPHGYAVVKKLKGNQETVSVLGTVDLQITEERTLIDEGKTNQTVFIGKLRYRGLQKNFEIDSDTWYENSELYKHLGKICGTAFDVLRPNIDYYRQAAVAFSEEEPNHIVSTVYYGTQGWYDETYIMPSVVVDRDGVRPNTEKLVDLSGKEHARCLDFRMLSENEFKEVMFHLKSDFFNAYPRDLAFSALAHSMQAGVLALLNIRIRPSYWIEGLTGTGKTELTNLVQQFWGTFPSLLNWRSSANGMLDQAYQFKDALMVVDDYKMLGPAQVKAAKDTVQYAFDQNLSSKLRRDGRQRLNKNARCLFMMSGEETPVNDASVISRMFLVYHPGSDNYKTKEAYDKCWDYAPLYNGVTPRFLHWFLTQDRTTIRRALQETKDKLQEPIREAQNATRVANNLALNYVVWRLFVNFMHDSGIVDPKEARDLIEEHWIHIEKIRDSIIGRCEEEQNGRVFLSVLRELIQTGVASIKNLTDYDGERAKEIGFVKDVHDGVVYIYPNITMEMVIKSSSSSALRGTKLSFFQQLKAMGVILDTGGKTNSKQVRPGKGMKRQWVWVVSLEALGLDQVEKETPEPEALLPPKLNPDGLL